MNSGTPEKFTLKRRIKISLKTSRRGLYYAAGVLAANAARNLPLSVSRRLFSGLAAVISLLVPGALRNAGRNLDLAYGDELSKKEKKRIVRRMLSNIGKTFAEFLHLPLMPARRIRAMIRTDEGFEKMKKITDSGSGVIAVSAHIGNWELLGAYTALHMPTTAVARKIYMDKFDRWVNRTRTGKNVNVIYQQEGPRPLLRAIKDGHLIGILADQDIDRISGVFVDFFGRPAYTATAPVTLAAKTGTPLFLYALVREGRGHFLHAEGPIEMQDTGDARADALANTQKWTDALERLIRKHPDQWVWFHRRWKTQQKPEPATPLA